MHWYIAMETCLRCQLPKSGKIPEMGLEGGPGGAGQGSHHMHAPSFPRSLPALLLMPSSLPDRAKFGPVKEWEEVWISK